MNKKQYLNTDYIIYEDGRCYSNKSKKFLTPQMSTKYPAYNLTIDGVKKKIKIHRMVAIAFIDNPENKEYVNHIDGDTHNYSIYNLEWATPEENSKHAMKTGLTIKNDQTLTNINESIIPGEEWRTIKDYPQYLVSNFGRILNINTNRIKKTPLDNNGYPHVNLWCEGKNKTFQVHRLEYIAFYPEENLDGYVINHIDGDKENNKLINLEKITYSENNSHAEYIIKTHGCSKAVLMLDQAGNILKEFESITRAQKETGFTNISRAIKKKYATKGYYWKFKD